MRARYLLILIFLLGLFFALGSAVLYSQPEERFQLRRKRAEERIRTVKIWKLTEALELTEEQAEKFFPKYHKFESRIRDLNQAREKELRKLRELTEEEEVSDKDLEKVIDECEKLGMKIFEEKKAFRKDVKGVLSSWQVARLVLFENRFPRRVREIIRELEHRSPPPPPDPRRPMDY